MIGSDISAPACTVCKGDLLLYKNLCVDNCPV
jgi:hypothetical protein